MIDGINATTQVIIGVCTAVALLAGAYKVLWYGKRNPYRPGVVKGFFVDMRGFRDAILGREAVHDSITGKEIAPALPGIGQRMATVEEALVSLATTHHRLDTVEATLEAHADEIAHLRAAAVERIVTRQESAQALRVMEAAIKADPDPDDAA